MQPLAPIPVTSADFDVALVPDGISAAITPGWVRAANESGFALQCSVGADSHWLQPWSVDVWPVHAVTTMHVHPVQLVTPIPASTWSVLLVTVAQPYERIPGTYPAALDRNTSSYANRQQLYPDGISLPQPAYTPSFVVPANSAGVTKTFTIPRHSTNLRLMFVQSYGVGAPNMSLGLVEHNTGAPLQPSNAVGPPLFGLDTGARPLDFRVEPSSDTQIDVLIALDGTKPAFNVFVHALLGAETTVVFPGISPVIVLQSGAFPPAPYVAPGTGDFLGTSFNLLAATYTNIVAAVGAANFLRLYYARFDIDAAGAGVFAVGTNGLIANVFSIVNAGIGPYILGPHPGGATVGLNAGIWLFTTNASTVRVHMSWAVGPS